MGIPGIGHTEKTPNIQEGTTGNLPKSIKIKSFNNLSKPLKIKYLKNPTRNMLT